MIHVTPGRFTRTRAPTRPRAADASGGRPLNLLGESVGGLSITAHADHEFFGHRGLYVADASVIPANRGVNLVRWVRDELRAGPDGVVVAMTFVDLPLLRRCGGTPAQLATLREAAETVVARIALTEDDADAAC